MSDESFPCVRIEFPSPCNEPRALVMKWIESRDSENWALISGTSLASETHAWVALDVMNRNRDRQVMRSNSMDGEFMRLLSGTHHISASFSRAGIIEGEKFGYIVDLSNSASFAEFESHATRMDFKILDQRPSIEIFDFTRMGIEIGNDENAAIGHIHLSDLR